MKLAKQASRSKITPFDPICIPFAGDVEKAPGKAMERVSLFMSQTSPRCLVEGSSAGGASAGSFWLSGWNFAGRWGPTQEVPTACTLISDNLKQVALANKLTKDKKRLNRLLIAVDAKKAFYTVRHPFIREVLKKIGLGSFIPIWNLLYSESQADIMINARSESGLFYTS